MFPNFRLMIVAIMASILGMSCALGVFAVFGVRRDPILRLPSAAPLLLAFSNAPMAPSAPVTNGVALAPFDTRFTVTLPTASVASGSVPSKVNTVIAVAAAPRETGATEHVTKTDEASSETVANSETKPEATSTEVTKPEATTTDVTSTEVKPEATTAGVTSTEVKPEATTAGVTSTEVKPDGASALTSGNGRWYLSWKRRLLSSPR